MTPDPIREALSDDLSSLIDDLILAVDRYEPNRHEIRDARKALVDGICAALARPVDQDATSVALIRCEQKLLANGFKWSEERQEWLSPIARPVDQGAAVVDDLRTLVTRLAHELRKAAPSNGLPNKAMDYLDRAGLRPDALRRLGGAS